ncbi:serine protease [Rhizocola hellebori]|uniref:Serine protease n=1 Tax=Rhizocola hellebori TaxID=1392758 RepID=A0A8J3Q2G1_9ACTN|nr:S8/S53 family peptidase [Rhizocola hellebori]GIH02120.1 serine protease [Rhizocola hellebori]
MALSEDRLRQWQQRRASRMRGLSWLGQETRPGGLPVWFAQGELLVLADHRQSAERVLGQLGAAGSIEESQLAPGLIRYRGSGLDVPVAARRLRQLAQDDGDDRVAASPNHVFLSAPFEHGGPFGPPVPALRPRTLPARSAGQVSVAVLDTGVWRNSPLPARAYTAADGDYESDTDVDNDGVLDGDVGHANFIIGVLAAQTQKAGIRAIRVLDTFGACTEADLIVALGRLGDEKLINLSLGGFTLDDQPPLALSQALGQVLAGRERLVVAAAGNDGQRGRPFWPAAFAGADVPWARQVVAVAAHDGTGICQWSNSGEWVSLAAPGADITSTFVRHEQFPTGWALWSGTSFATPHVVAALAEELSQAATVQAALAAVMAKARANIVGQYPGLP